MFIHESGSDDKPAIVFLHGEAANGNMLATIRSAVQQHILDKANDQTRADSEEGTVAVYPPERGTRMGIPPVCSRTGESR